MIKVPRAQQPPGDRVLWHDELVWVGSAKRPRPPTEPLSYVSFGPGCFYHPIASRELARGGRSFRTVLESPSLAGVREAVAEGLGVAILDRSTVGPDLAELADLNEAVPLPGVAYVVRAASGVADELVRAVSDDIESALGRQKAA